MLVCGWTINRPFYRLIVRLFPIIPICSRLFLFISVCSNLFQWIFIFHIYFFSRIVCDNKFYKSCIVVLFVLGHKFNIFYICFSSYLLWNWLILRIFIYYIFFLLITNVIFSISTTYSFTKLSCDYKLNLVILC